MKKVYVILGILLLTGLAYGVYLQSNRGYRGDNEATGEGEAELEGENEGVVVQISEFAFAPETLTVEPGETITVINMDSVGHTMTSDDGEAFDSGMMEQNESFTFNAPVEPGEYPYHCTSHPNMKAMLTVAGE